MVRDENVPNSKAPSALKKRFDARSYRQLLGGRPKEVKKMDTAREHRFEDHGKKVETPLKISDQPSSNQHLDGGVARGTGGVGNPDMRKDGEGITNEPVSFPDSPVEQLAQSNEPVSFPDSPVEQLAQSNKSVQRTGSPKVNEYWVPVRLSDLQLEQYCATLLKNTQLLCSSLKSEIVDGLHNIILAILKCCDHPYLGDNALQRCATSDSLKTGIEASGKLRLLDKFLQEIKDRGLRVLILYQSLGSGGKNSLTIGDILDDFICQRFGRESYAHIYGRQMEPSKKQEALNLFNDDENNRIVLLVENSPCQHSIKVSSLDVVILYNSELDPHNDRKTLHKMTLHCRSGQLMVFRLYTSCTLEEKTLVQAKNGMTVENNIYNVSHSVSHMLLFWGAPNLFESLDDYHGCCGAVRVQAFSPDVLPELSRCLIDGGRIKFLHLANAEAGNEGYRDTITLHGESKVQTMDDVPPHVLWASLLAERCPQWRLLPGQPQWIRRSAQLPDNELQHDEDARKTTTRKCRMRSNTAGEHVGRKRVGDKEKLVGRKKSRKLTGTCQSSYSDGVRFLTSPNKTAGSSDCSDDGSARLDVIEDNPQAENVGLAESREYHGAAREATACSSTVEQLEKERRSLSNQRREIGNLDGSRKKEQEQLEKECQLEVDRIYRECTEKAAMLGALKSCFKEKCDRIKDQREMEHLEKAQLAERVEEKRCSDLMAQNQSIENQNASNRVLEGAASTNKACHVSQSTYPDIQPQEDTDGQDTSNPDTAVSELGQQVGAGEPALSIRSCENQDEKQKALATVLESLTATKMVHPVCQPKGDINGHRAEIIETPVSELRQQNVANKPTHIAVSLGENQSENKQNALKVLEIDTSADAAPLVGQSKVETDGQDAASLDTTVSNLGQQNGSSDPKESSSLGYDGTNSSSHTEEIIITVDGLSPLEQPTASFPPLLPDIEQTGDAMSNDQNGGLCESIVEVRASPKLGLVNSAMSIGQSIIQLADSLPLSFEGAMLSVEPVAALSHEPVVEVLTSSQPAVATSAMSDGNSIMQLADYLPLSAEDDLLIVELDATASCETVVEVQASSQPPVVTSAMSLGQPIIQLADPLPLPAEDDIQSVGRQALINGVNIHPASSGVNFMGNAASRPTLALLDGCASLDMEMYKILEEMTKEDGSYREKRMHLDAAHEKELEEVNRKYFNLKRDAEVAHRQKKEELNIKHRQVEANKQLAIAFASINLMPEAGRPPAQVRTVDQLSDLISTELSSSRHHGPAPHLRATVNRQSIWTAQASAPPLQLSRGLQAQVSAPPLQLSSGLHAQASALAQQPSRPLQGMSTGNSLQILNAAANQQAQNSWTSEFLSALRQASGASGVPTSHNYMI